MGKGDGGVGGMRGDGMGGMEELQELNSVLGTLTFVPTSNAAKNRRRGDLCFKNVFMKEEEEEEERKEKKREFA